MSHGSRHWRAQRLGALALIPLTLWLLTALLMLPDYSFDTVHAWAAAPGRAIAISVLVAVMAWHSQLGVQVVIEDYVHSPATQKASLFLNTCLHVLLGAAGVLAAASIAFRG